MTEQDGMTGRPPPPPIDWERQDPPPTSLWRAALEVVRFMFTGKGTKP